MRQLFEKSFGTHALALGIILSMILAGAAPGLAEEKSVAEEILEILKARNQITDQEYRALMKKAKEEKLEAMEVAQAADEDFRIFWDEGITMEALGGDFEIEFGGRIMVDFTGVTADEEIKDAFAPGDIEGHGAEFRRARLFFEGMLYDSVQFKSQFDFAGGDVDFKDVWVGLMDIPFVNHIRFGHMKEPMSLEELTSSKYITFMERSLPVAAFAPSRNTGVRLHNSVLNDRMTWAAGFFLEADDTGESDFNDDEDYQGTVRVTGLPWYGAKDQLIHLGVGYTHKFRDEGPTVRFRTRPETHILPERLVNTDSFEANSVDIVNPEFAAVYGPFSFQAEYFHTFVDSPMYDDPEFHGFYVYASVFLTGESRNYKPSAGSFSRVKPIKNFHPINGGLGAWELAARYSYVDLNDGMINGGEEGNVTAGLNWYLNPNMRIMFNYVYFDVEDRNSDGVVIDDGQGHTFQTRFQVDF